MRKIQSQGVHHITLVGADRETSIGFWEGVLGMPFIFEQPNLDRPEESHLYFDPGDGRLITIFTNEERTPDGSWAPCPSSASPATRPAGPSPAGPPDFAALTQAAARHQITILAPPGTGRAVPATRPRWRSRGARARCGTG